MGIPDHIHLELHKNYITLIKHLEKEGVKEAEAIRLAGYVNSVLSTSLDVFQYRAKEEDARCAVNSLNGCITGMKMNGECKKFREIMELIVTHLQSQLYFDLLMNKLRSGPMQDGELIQNNKLYQDGYMLELSFNVQQRVRDEEDRREKVKRARHGNEMQILDFSIFSK